LTNIHQKDAVDIVYGPDDQKPVLFEISDGKLTDENNSKKEYTVITDELLSDLYNSNKYDYSQDTENLFIALYSGMPGINKDIQLIEITKFTQKNKQEISSTWNINQYDDSLNKVETTEIVTFSACNGIFKKSIKNKGQYDFFKTSVSNTNILRFRNTSKTVTKCEPNGTFNVHPLTTFEYIEWQGRDYVK